MIQSTRCRRRILEVMMAALAIALLAPLHSAEGQAGSSSTPASGVPARSPTTRRTTARPDFAELPRGVFSDGRHYQLSDFEGKILVVVYFNPDYDASLEKLKDTVMWLKTVSDQPVAVVGISQGSVGQLRGVLQGKGPGFPIFCDNLGIYRAMYNFYGTCGCRLIHDGKVQHIIVDGFSREWSAGLADVNKLVPDVSWKYKDGGYDKRLSAVVDLLEWNHYEEGLKKLKPMRKDSNKLVADSANKLFDAVAAEGETWKTNADKLAADEPIKAYDLYARIAQVFAGEELAVKVAAPIKDLKANASVAAELQAREMMGKLMAFAADASSADRTRVSESLLAIVQKYGQTPTGKAAESMYTAWERSHQFGW